MNWYCEGSSSWRSATPTVRMSAKTSKPSKVQPRLEATSAFHCVRLSARYQGAVAAAVSLMPFLPLIFAQRLVPAAIYQEAYADLAWGWKDPVARIEGSEIFAPSGLQLTSRGVGRVRADGLRFACKEKALTAGVSARSVSICKRGCCSSLDPLLVPPPCWPRWRSR